MSLSKIREIRKKEFITLHQIAIMEDLDFSSLFDLQRVYKVFPAWSVDGWTKYKTDHVRNIINWWGITKRHIKDLDYTKEEIQSMYPQYVEYEQQAKESFEKIEIVYP